MLVALARAEVVRDPAVLRREERGEELYQAVRGVRVEDCAHVAPLVRELAGSGDAVLEGEAVRLAGEGLRARVLDAGFARDTLTGLLASASGAVVGAALAALAEPWAVVPPLPPERFAGLFGPATADAALTAAVAHGHGESLWRAAVDPGQPPRVRRRALALYGETARRGDVPAVLRLAGEDPLLLAGPAVECLRAMHRRGHFVTGPDVPAVLGLALADHTVPARTVATVLFTARHDVLRLSADGAPDDPTWPRRLDLLVALDEQGVGGLPVAAEIARLLPLASAPAPFLRALRALRDPGTEDAVLAALPHAPAAALDALEAVGGERTVRVLGAALGLDACAPADGDRLAAHAVPEPGRVERALRAHRGRALELVWLLATDPGVRRELLVRMDAAALPTRVAADLGGPDERELALLAAHVDPGRPVAALTRLAEHAGPGLLPVLADLLLRIAGEAASAWEPDGAEPVPDEEPRVAPEAVAALCRLGRRLHARGRIRPVCLLDVGDAEAAGHALVADLALGLLDRPGLMDGERAVLLRLLLDLPDAPHRTIRRRVHPLLRHPDRHVRKHVVALLARAPGGDGVEAVSATLLALTGPDRDPQTVRRTLGALGDAGARWASDAIAACLDHPQMNVRKTAARALATAGTARAVPRLLDRLGRDDNPGLRDLLLDALRALLGDTFPATVTAAADHAADARVRDRLLAAPPGTRRPTRTRPTSRAWRRTAGTRTPPCASPNVRRPPPGSARPARTSPTGSHSPPHRNGRGARSSACCRTGSAPGPVRHRNAECSPGTPRCSSTASPRRRARRGTGSSRSWRTPRTARPSVPKSSKPYGRWRRKVSVGGPPCRCSGGPAPSSSAPTSTVNSPPPPRRPPRRRPRRRCYARRSGSAAPTPGRPGTPNSPPPRGVCGSWPRTGNGERPSVRATCSPRSPTSTPTPHRTYGARSSTG
ncbi:HEAT repeat domain-containing protein [Streptomyces sp. NPDC059762]|uniref:HEAT repeat domain-containing protein n=1 Tax=Streptomyces sp. NPDC059762 TaxID=3346938 RepID=UPI00365296B3